MNILDLSYQILTGGEHELLVAENLIETARWLEEQGLVRCAQEECGMRVQLNMEGIDVWMKNELNKCNVGWIPHTPCVYGIALKRTSQILLEQEQTLFMPPHKGLWIRTTKPPRTYGNNDIVVHFADIFCEKINLRQLVERIAINKDVAFVLKWEKGELYLNEHVIVTARSNIRKAIMQILIERQKNNQEYIPFEEIADTLQERHDFVIDDIHSQIYKHINVLQQRGREKVPQLTQLGDFIEIHNCCCRLNPLIWATD
jgi:hypothetical protein